VGGTQPTRVDVRIVAASNKDLQAAMEAEAFREDLFYRLNVIPVYIPPLRERPEDVPALVDAFLRKHSDGRRRSIAPAAVERLKECSWKGNARELENVLERALALSDSEELGIEDLPLGSAGLPQENSGTDAALHCAARDRLSLRELEERYIDEVLGLTNGNKVQAAKILGIDRKTLYRRAERRKHTG
jgi:two-component system response regulator AtoC